MSKVCKIGWLKYKLRVKLKYNLRSKMSLVHYKLP